MIDCGPQLVETRDSIKAAYLNDTPSEQTERIISSLFELLDVHMTDITRSRRKFPDLQVRKPGPDEH
jgi:hypothetical protein